MVTQKQISVKMDEDTLMSLTTIATTTSDTATER